MTDGRLWSSVLEGLRGKGLRVCQRTGEIWKQGELRRERLRPGDFHCVMWDVLRGCEGFGDVKWTMSSEVIGAARQWLMRESEGAAGLQTDRLLEWLWGLPDPGLGGVTMESEIFRLPWRVQGIEGREVRWARTWLAATMGKAVLRGMGEWTNSMDQGPVLMSEAQGIGKTKVWEKLAPWKGASLQIVESYGAREFYSDVCPSVFGVWDEMAGLGRLREAQQKQVWTQSEVTTRQLRSLDSVTRSRYCEFVGTANGMSVIPSGLVERRVVPVVLEWGIGDGEHPVD